VYGGPVAVHKSTQYTTRNRPSHAKPTKAQPRINQSGIITLFHSSHQPTHEDSSYNTNYCIQEQHQTNKSSIIVYQL
jgi:hypothetical protein